MSEPQGAGAGNRVRDQEVLARIARGETGAVAELYDSHGAQVFSLVLRIVENVALAEDLVQDVFVRVWRSAASYRPELGSVQTWLLAIAHHRAVDEWRRLRWESGSVSLDETGPDWLAATPESLYDPFLHRALNELPGEQRQVIDLAYFRGLTISEIASRLHLPPGTVKSRVRLAMAKLRSRLGVEEKEKP